MAFFNDNGPTIPLRPLAPVVVPESTPAILALQDALKSGATDYATVIRHFNDAPNMQAERATAGAITSKANSDVALAPERDAAERSRLAAEVPINALRKVAAENAVDLAPAQKESAVADLEAKKFSDAQAALARPTVAAGNQASTLAAQGTIEDQQQANDSGVGDAAAYKFFLDNQKNLGTLPRDPVTQKIDFPTLHKIVDSYSADVRNNSGVKDSPERTQLVKAAIERNVNPYTTDGKRKSDAQLAFDISAAPTELDATDLKNVNSRLQSVPSFLNSLDKASKFVNDTSTTPVGPELWRGGAPLFVNTLAKVGLNSDKKAQQDYLRITLAENVQKAIKDLAGSGNRVMRAEIENKPNADGTGGGLFYQAMPALGSAPEIWNEWIDRRKNLLIQAYQADRDSLPESGRKDFPPLTATPTPGPKIGSSAPTAPTSPSAPSTWQTFNSVPEAAHLAPGAIFKVGNQFYRRN